MAAPSLTSEPVIVAAARTIIEQSGISAMSMQAVAEAVGVRGPSLYKRVHGRDDLIRRVLDAVAAELTDTLDDASLRGRTPAERALHLLTAYRHFAHINPACSALLFAPEIPHSAERAARSSASLLEITTALVGKTDALPAARTLVAWAHGFVSMELAGAFRLGANVDEAWTYGAGRIIAAIAA